MVNFSFHIFCSILTARPSCSKLNLAPSRKIIKIQGKFCWKLDSNIFITLLTLYFYHFQIIPVNCLKLAYVQLPTLTVSTLFHSSVHNFQSVHENCMIQGYLTKKLDFEQLTSGEKVQITTFQQVKNRPEVEGKKMTYLKLILSHFSSFCDKFFLKHT